jgi:MOSC domain-containing protein YiiM
VNLHLAQVRLGGVKTVEGLRSAIFKESVEGPVRLAALGLDGDDVADHKNHGGPDQAVLGLPSIHYAKWKAEGHPFEVGAFGENFLIEGLDEDEVCIGDVFRVGEVEVQVAHPRVPCGTLAKRLKVPVLQRVWETARGGFYLRVMKTGTVRAGDAVTRLAHPHPEWTVRRALHAQWKVKDRPDEALALAALPELSAHWRERLPRQASGKE